MSSVATLHTNFNAPQMRLEFEALRALDSAAVSICALAMLTERPTEFRGPRSFMAFGLPDRPLDESRADATNAILTATFRRLIEEIALFMEEIRKLCAIALLFKDTTEVDATLYQERVVGAAADAFLNLSLDKKFVELRRTYGIRCKLKGDIVSLNKTRNCFTHRRGVVETKDCGKGQALVVTWRCAQIVAAAHDGKRRLVDGPITLEGGSRLLLESRRSRRTFARGSPVVFDVDDLLGFWWTIHQFASELSLSACEFAKAHGVVFASPAGEER